MFQNLNILGDWRTGEALESRDLAKRGRECAERGEVERTVAPLQHLDGIEGVALQSLGQIRLERRAAPGRAEGAVARRTAGAAGDLRQFGRVQLAELISVELAVARERDVVHVEVQP